MDGRAGTARKGELIQKRYLPIFTVRKEKFLFVWNFFAGFAVLDVLLDLVIFHTKK